MMFFRKRELRRLQKRLEEIIKTDTNAGLTTATSDKDVADLAATINSMLDRNQQNLFQKDRAETELRRAVTNISHDLRTPLTSAMGYLQMLEQSDLEPEETERYIAIIQERLESLSSLMNNLFEFSLVIEGKTELHIKPVNVSNILRDALSNNYDELESKGFKVDVNIPDEPVIILCDENELNRILQNLIKNVYVHGKEYLKVNLEHRVIEIANKTDGLTESDARHIFERFYTIDASRTSNNTGLGLAIAKELTERMGGKISAHINEDLLVMRVEF